MIKMISVLLLAFGLAFSANTDSQVLTPNDTKYDFTFVDMEFAAVFRSVSTVAHVDIVIAPEVKGTTSLNITKKTWQDALDIVCEMNDLTWTIQDRYIFIQKSSTYQVKQKKIAEEEAKAEQNAPLVRKNFQIHHAKAEELIKVLESMKSSRGRITTVDRTNSIIVYDVDDKISQMEKALNELDIETLQIMITAKLVVVNSERARELGVDWTAKMGTTALTPGVAGTPTGSVAGASRTSAAIQSFPHEGVTPAVSGASTAITASLLDNNLQVALTNLMGDASTEVLASPQVSTLDNTEALVFMGDKVSIRVIDDSGESSTQLVETGIKLTVTPHVSADNRILLDLHPENNSYGYDEKGEIVISTQEAKTKVVVADGETVVIGGLTRNENTESESGIPFLKDIPLLGNLFKYSRKAVTKRDLVIFVTPRIIRNYIGDIELSEPSEEIKASPVAKPVADSLSAETVKDSVTPAVDAPVAQSQTAETKAEAPVVEQNAAPEAPAVEESSDWE